MKDFILAQLYDTLTHSWVQFHLVVFVFVFEGGAATGARLSNYYFVVICSPSILMNSIFSNGDFPYSLFPFRTRSSRSFRSNLGYFLAAYSFVSTQTEFEMSF